MLNKLLMPGQLYQKDQARKEFVKAAITLSEANIEHEHKNAKEEKG